MIIKKNIINGITFAARIINLINHRSMQQQPSVLKFSEKYKKINRLTFHQKGYPQMPEASYKESTKLRQYIKNYVQSQRKNILDLYSSTIVNSEETNESRSQVEMIRTSPGKKGEKIRLQSCNPYQNVKINHEQNEQHLIHSIKLDIKPGENKNMFDRLRWKSIETKRATKTLHLSIKQTKKKDPSPRKTSKPPLPPLPMLKSRSSKGKSKTKASISNQIDPWQYLVIPDHPSIFSL